MAVTRLDIKQVERLADDVRAKILDCPDVIIRAQGEIVIRVFRKGDGFDIKLRLDI